MAHSNTTNETTLGFMTVGARTRQREDAIHQGEAVVRDLAERLSPDDLRQVIETLKRVFEKPTAPESSQKKALLDRLTGGRTVSQEERAELEFSNLQRSLAFRGRILEGALTAPQASELLGSKSRQTPHDRRKAGTLLAFKERGAWRFPSWQFDLEGPDRVVTGLPQVLRALGEFAPVSDWQKAGFLLHVHPSLGGRTALQALQEGDVDDVVAAARGVGES